MVDYREAYIKYTIKSYVCLDLHLVKAMASFDCIGLLQFLINRESILENAGLLKSQQGWFYCTGETVLKGTGISLDRQSTIINKLLKADFIEYEIREKPPKRFFKINYKQIMNTLESAENPSKKYIEKVLPEPGKLNKDIYEVIIPEPGKLNNPRTWEQYTNIFISYNNTIKNSYNTSYYTLFYANRVSPSFSLSQCSPLSNIVQSSPSVITSLKEESSRENCLKYSSKNSENGLENIQKENEYLDNKNNGLENKKNTYNSDNNKYSNEYTKTDKDNNTNNNNNTYNNSDISNKQYKEYDTLTTPKTTKGLFNKQALKSEKFKDFDARSVTRYEKLDAVVRSVCKKYNLDEKGYELLDKCTMFIAAVNTGPMTQPKVYLENLNKVLSETTNLNELNHIVSTYVSNANPNYTLSSQLQYNKNQYRRNNPHWEEEEMFRKAKERVEQEKKNGNDGPPVDFS